jgi:hypothetical protein
MNSVKKCAEKTLLNLVADAPINDIGGLFVLPVRPLIGVAKTVYAAEGAPAGSLFAFRSVAGGASLASAPAPVS